MWTGTISGGRGEEDGRTVGRSEKSTGQRPVTDSRPRSTAESGPTVKYLASRYLLAMSRILIVANRLPITVSATEGGVEVQRSTGGLATGLMRPHENSDGLWIGWSGAPADLNPEQQAALDRELAAMRLVG